MSSDLKPICPCGKIANSIFNDTLRLFRSTNLSDYDEQTISRGGMVWSTDQTIKFNNQQNYNRDYNISTESLKETYSYAAKPKYWANELHEFIDTSGNIGLDNEELIIWMRLAAFPSFVKPYGYLKQQNQTDITMSAGNYRLVIGYNYPVKGFSGTKRVLFTNTSLLGSYNPVIWYFSLLVGMIYIIAMFIIIILNNVVGKSKYTLLEYIDNDISAIT